jgi:hypothetical protein
MASPVLRPPSGWKTGDVRCPGQNPNRHFEQTRSGPIPAPATTGNGSGWMIGPVSQEPQTGHGMIGSEPQWEQRVSCIWPSSNPKERESAAVTYGSGFHSSRPALA